MPAAQPAQSRGSVGPIRPVGWPRSSADTQRLTPRAAEILQRAIGHVVSRVGSGIPVHFASGQNATHPILGRRSRLSSKAAVGVSRNRASTGFSFRAKAAARARRARRQKGSPARQVAPRDRVAREPTQRRRRDSAHEPGSAADAIVSPDDRRRTNAAGSGRPGPAVGVCLTRSGPRAAVRRASRRASELPALTLWAMPVVVCLAELSTGIDLGSVTGSHSSIVDTAASSMQRTTPSKTDQSRAGDHTDSDLWSFPL